MRVFVSGATGYVGSGVSRALRDGGHEVVGLARSDESAGKLEYRGDGVVRGHLARPDSFVDAAAEADAVIHAGHTGGADAARVDREAVEAILDALEGSGKPFVYTSGCWVLGDTGETVADEEHPLDPIDLVAWRAELEPAVREASRGNVGTVVVRPAHVYGRGGGIPANLVDEALGGGPVRVVGDGLQEVAVVHVDDLGDLYLRALGAPAGSLYQAASGPSYTMRDIALGACVAAGVEPAVEPWPREAAVEELGGFGKALGLSQRISGARAREELGWRPSAPTLLEELVAGSYRAG